MTELRLEPIRGWRLWRVRRDGVGYRLASWCRGEDWPERERLEARCRRFVGRSHGRAPEPGHACGIYAVRTRELAESLLRSMPATRAGTIAIGTVSLWGRVIENVGGWRAQFAYPYELFVPGAGRDVVSDLTRRYAVDASAA